MEVQEHFNKRQQSYKIYNGSHHPATGVAFEEGYWTFNMIADRLAESGITLERHKHDNKCSILSPKS